MTTSTPLPAFANADHVVPIVFDVRWRWTRSPVGRWYRHADLLQTVRRSSHVLTISHAVADQLAALRCLPSGGYTVLDLGPGQFQGMQATPAGEREPSVVLIGAAPHKRNELAAELLGSIPAFRRDGRVTAISVSDATVEALRRHFRPDQLDIRSGVDRDELAACFAGARAYVALGTSEGFGFAYIEAAHQGCDVIAIRQALTIELFGDDAVLLASRSPTADDLDRALTGWELDRVQALQARALRRDWDVAAEQTADAIGPLL